MKPLITFVAIIILVLATKRYLGVKPYKIPDDVAKTCKSGFFVLGITPMFYSVPYMVLNEANEEKELKALATFLRLKKRYGNSCYFGFNAHSLSKKSGLSYTAAKRYTEIFLN